MFRVGWRELTVLVLAGLSLTACAGRPLMPTPNLYVGSATNPFQGVPAELQSSEVELLYLTDRQPERGEDGELRYGYGRSTSLGWGIATVALGRDVSWPDLVQASLAPDRARQLEVEFVSVRERGRSPDTPIPYTLANDLPHPDPALMAQVRRAGAEFNRELSRRLAHARTKQVLLYVHGYRNTFQDAAAALAELWHFTARDRVPVLYTWPSGHPDLLRGYAYDRESSEFTVFHLKQAIRLISSHPQVERIQVIAHSRGTDAVVSAMRELFIESWTGGVNPKVDYRIDKLILIAPDLDIGVSNQRIMGEYLNVGVGQLVVYTSPDDTALSIAEYLFSSPAGRSGRFDITSLSAAQMRQLETAMRHHANVTIIRISGQSDGYGHSYFRTNPGASSDLILTLQGHSPGSPQRPLESHGSGFWSLSDSAYPHRLDP